MSQQLAPMRWIGIFFLVVGVAVLATPRLLVAPEARAPLLALNGPTERYACLYGVRLGNTQVVLRVRDPKYTDHAARRASLFITEATCPGNISLLLVVHNHPIGMRCWYNFPALSMATSDLVSFERSGTQLGLIVCDSTLRWIMGPGPVTNDPPQLAPELPGVMGPRKGR